MTKKTRNNFKKDKQMQEEQADMPVQQDDLELNTITEPTTVRVTTEPTYDQLEPKTYNPDNDEIYNDDHSSELYDFIEQAPDEEEQPAPKVVDMTHPNVLALQGYLDVMSDDNATIEEATQQQKQLYRLIGYIFNSNDAVERLSHFVSLIADNLDGAFNRRRAFRTIGMLAVTRTEAEATEFRELLQVLITIANPVQANKSFINYDSLRDYLLPHNADKYIEVLMAVAGENNV